VPLATPSPLRLWESTSGPKEEEGGGGSALGNTISPPPVGVGFRTEGGGGGGGPGPGGSRSSRRPVSGWRGPRRWGISPFSPAARSPSDAPATTPRGGQEEGRGRG